VERVNVVITRVDEAIVEDVVGVVVEVAGAEDGVEHEHDDTMSGLWAMSVFGILHGRKRYPRMAYMELKRKAVGYVGMSL
jgi:hypothetical protein